MVEREAMLDALQSARSSGLPDQVGFPGIHARRLHSAERVYAILVTFFQALPEDATVHEVREALEDIHGDL